MPSTVLIVEDDADTRTVYRTALEARGYRVLVATNGAEGVHLARTARPDLILLDIRMPVMDGMEALTYLRAYSETRSIPVCAISAYELREEEAGRFGSTDFDCFLMKPMSPSEIVAEIEGRIGPPEHEGQVG